MKRRDPATFEDAVFRIAGALTAEGAGASIEKGKGRIYAATNRDLDNFSPLNIEQCVALDKAYDRATGDGFPIFDVYRRTLQASEVGPVVDPAERLVRVTKEVSEAVQAFHTKAALDELEREVNEACTALRSMLRDRRAELSREDRRAAE